MNKEEFKLDLPISDFVYELLKPDKRGEGQVGLPSDKSKRGYRGIKTPTQSDQKANWVHTAQSAKNVYHGYRVLCDFARKSRKFPRV